MHRSAPSLRRARPHSYKLYKRAGIFLLAATSTFPVLGLFFLLASGCTETPTPTKPGALKAVVCLSCHGADGNGPDPAMPKLANQNQAYLIDSMKAYADGRRNHELMRTFVAGLSEEDIVHIADFYSTNRCR